MDGRVYGVALPPRSAMPPSRSAVTGPPLRKTRGRAVCFLGAFKPP